jgi:uncharacterized membrane protein YccC
VGALWGTSASWLALPAGSGARLAVVVRCAGFGIGGRTVGRRRRRILLTLLPLTITFLMLLAQPRSETSPSPLLAYH